MFIFYLFNKRCATVCALTLLLLLLLLVLLFLLLLPYCFHYLGLILLLLLHYTAQNSAFGSTVDALRQFFFISTLAFCASVFSFLVLPNLPLLHRQQKEGGKVTNNREKCYELHVKGGIQHISFFSWPLLHAVKYIE